MDAVLKRDWIDALRGGEYKQGYNCLRPLRNQYCCLGVLCDVIDQKRWNLDSNLGSTVYQWIYEGEIYVGIPPYKVLSHELSDHLAHLNDTSNYSLEQIADWIEDNVRGTN